MAMWDRLTEAAQPYDPAKAAYSEPHAREFKRFIASLTPQERAVIQPDIDYVGEDPKDPVSALAAIQMSIGLYRIRQERQRAAEKAKAANPLLRRPNDRPIDALGRSDDQNINTGGTNESDSNEEIPGILDPVTILRAISAAIGGDGEDKDTPIPLSPTLHPDGVGDNVDNKMDIDTFKQAWGDPDVEADQNGVDDQGAIGFEVSGADGQSAYESRGLWGKLVGEKENLETPASHVPEEPGKAEGDGLKKRRVIEMFDGTVVYLVDGEYVRDNLDVDLIGGGHHFAYPSIIPKGEIWLCDVDPQPIATHEITEMLLMKYCGWSYEHAHEAANSCEAVIRSLRGQKP